MESKSAYYEFKRIADNLQRIADLLDGTTLGINVNSTIFNPQTPQNRYVKNG